MPIPHQSPVVQSESIRRGRRASPRPGLFSFLLVLPAYLVIGFASLSEDNSGSIFSWYISTAWALPAFTSAIGLMGARVAIRRLRKSPGEIPFRGAAVADGIIVVVPTVGRHDVCPALERVVTSLLHNLPSRFVSVRLDIVLEEGCEAEDRISRFARRDPMARILTVPRSYRTPAGTRFKARANHYAHERRICEGDARDDVWILHMDDDTAVCQDTVEAIASFIDEHGSGPRVRHLAQGILSYPRELAPRRLIWLADAIRPGCDVSIFAATTGLGSPLTGLHGELLLIRASVEAEIGWDFGPAAIVEDAHFALEFCARYPGKSYWLVGKSYGASPSTLGDFVRQRERWIWGLLTLATDRAVPLRRRLVLLQAVALWTFSPFQNPVLLLVAASVLGHPRAGPVSAVVIPFWAISFAFYIWLYWEGLKINAGSSAWPHRLWWEAAVLLLMLPVFSLWEVTGVVLGAARFARRRDATFTVITKPA